MVQDLGSITFLENELAAFGGVKKNHVEHVESIDNLYQQISVVIIFLPLKMDLSFFLPG